MTREFIYIKPEEKEKYEKLGYRIEVGPRGGIRAYFPQENLTVKLSQWKEKARGSDYPQSVFRKAQLVSWFVPNFDKLKFGASYQIGLFLDALGAFIHELYDDDPLKKELIKRYWGSEETFHNWLKNNVIEVKLDDYPGAYSRDLAFKLDGKLVVPKTAVLYDLITDISDWPNNEFPRGAITEAILNGQDYHQYIEKVIDKLKKTYGEFFPTFDEELAPQVERFIDVFAKLTAKVVSGEGKELGDKSADGLATDLAKVINPNINDYYAITNMYDRHIIFTLDKLFGSYVGEMLAVIDTFVSLGVRDESVFSLARGWLMTRLWASSGFKYFTGYIEEKVHDCFNLKTLVRKKLDYEERVYTRIGLEITNCQDIKNWQKVVSKYLKKVLGEQITVYRGIRSREIAAAFASMQAKQPIRVLGTMESMTVEQGIAADWGEEGFHTKARINVDSIIGCWLNASPVNGPQEAEVMVVKPNDGLVVELYQYDSEVTLDDAVSFPYLLEDGIDSLKKLYGENDYVKWVESQLKPIIERVKEQERKASKVNRVRGDPFEDFGFLFGKEDKFIYIRPDDIQEYIARGYRIERGPRGGIRAYFPVNEQSGENELEVKDRPELEDVKNPTLRILVGASDSFPFSWIEYDIKVLDSIQRHPELIDEYKDRIVTIKDNEKFKILLEQIDWEDIAGNELPVVELGDGRIITTKGIGYYLLLSVGTNVWRNVDEVVWTRDEYTIKVTKEQIQKLRSVFSDVFDEKFVDGMIQYTLQIFEDLDTVLNSEAELIIETNSIAEKLLPYGMNKHTDEVKSLEESFSFNPGFFKDFLEDRVSGFLVGSYRFFRDVVGLDERKAASLARGWTFNRLWMNEDFVRVAGLIEKKVKECFGHGGLVRKEQMMPLKQKYFLKYIVNCEDIKNWAKVTHSYLRKVFNSDKIRIYRGLRDSEVLMGLIDYLNGNDFATIGGVLDSFSYDKEAAQLFGKFVATAEVPIESAVSCWLTASKDLANSEREILLMKPSDGLKVEIVRPGSLGDVSIKKYLENSSWLREFVEEAKEDMDKVYGPEFTEMFEQRMLIPTLAKVKSSRIKNILRWFR